MASTFPSPKPELASPKPGQQDGGGGGMGGGGGTSTLPSPPPRESLRKMQCSSLMKCPLRTMSCRLSASSLPTLLKNHEAAGQAGQQSPSTPTAGLLLHAASRGCPGVFFIVHTRMYILWEYRGSQQGWARGHQYSIALGKSRWPPKAL